MAAAIGTRFRENILIAACEMDAQDAFVALDEAHRANLIQRETDGQISFVHDKVLEAFLSKKRHAHSESSQQNCKGLCSSEKATAENLYAIARHLSIGAPGGDETYLWNLKAAEQALSEYANNRVYQFMQNASLCESQTDATFYASFGEACLATAHLKDAIDAFNKALELETDKHLRTKLRGRLHQTSLLTWKFVRVGNSFEVTLRSLGIHFRIDRLVCDFDIVVVVGFNFHAQNPHWFWHGKRSCQRTPPDTCRSLCSWC